MTLSVEGACKIIPLQWSPSPSTPGTWSRQLGVPMPSCLPLCTPPSSLNIITQGEEINLLLKIKSFILSHKVQQMAQKRNHNTLVFPFPSLFLKKSLKPITDRGMELQFKASLTIAHINIIIGHWKAYDPHSLHCYTTDKIYYPSIFFYLGCLLSEFYS
jgi:hypothetical protein